MQIVQERDLFGNPIKDRTRRIVLFADEIKPGEHSPWVYGCILCVAEDKLRDALGRLMADRDSCGYHQEIGWKDVRGDNLRPGAKEALATRWLTRVVTEPDVWRFAVFGVDTSKIRTEMFGTTPGEQIKNSYRRFFRATLKYMVRLSNADVQKVHIVKAYHDQEGNLESDGWFSWHALHSVGQQTDVVVECREVCFVNSCHAKELRHSKASHFIQLSDIIVGATRYIFEDVGSGRNRDRAAAPLIPLIERLTCPKRSHNRNSRYQHVGRVNVSFFPRTSVSARDWEDPIARAKSCFYSNRPIRDRHRKQDTFQLDL